jgi:RNA polymerase sigma-70 factor (ECF subfamily)
MAAPDAATSFEPLRPRLLRIAYRMLGSVADAEDVVQDAFMRWQATARETVAKPEAFLRRTVTRLCLDVLKSSRRSRETYIGPWLPDPIVEEDSLDDDVTLPLMLALERLSPLERAAFLLHDVFGASFEEVADTIGREPAACRQLASRARANVRQARPRYAVPKEHGMRIAAAFFAASREGDVSRLRSLLADDVVVRADGGGRKPAALAPIAGLEAVLAAHARFAEAFARSMSRLVRYVVIDGLPGFLTVEADETLQTTALDIRDGRIVAVYVTRNPDKLRHLAIGALQ